VRQTVAMLRDHEHDYELGPGYTHKDDGSFVECYWQRRREPRTESAPPAHGSQQQRPGPPGYSAAEAERRSGAAAQQSDGRGLPDDVHCRQCAGGAAPDVPPPCPRSRKLPYSIELVGVTCDPTLAVARGFWRKLRSGRSVPVAAQLRSHRLFAENWCRYCKLVDSATLYHTGAQVTGVDLGG
jgi:hypothetical protein